jgi:23S rRNA pseudouridine1911/1915/1917 synthase
MAVSFILKSEIQEKDQGRKLGDFVRSELQLSRRAIKTIKFKGGAFLINGAPQKVTYVLKEGEHLEVHFPPEIKSETLTPEEMPLDIVFEDAYALVINKEAGIPTIPSYQHFKGTLANGVVDYLLKKGEEGASHPVTRLDRETSGLVLMAKHGHVHDLFSRLQKERLIHRRYLAVVHGEILDQFGTIDAPIGRKEGSIIERCVSEEGKPAITHYEVLSKMKNSTLVGIQLETGRTHQIRVHFSSIGHPLVGDDLYGGDQKEMTRQALHARHLYFPHPLIGETVFCTAPFPQDLQSLIDQEGGGMEAIHKWDQKVLSEYKEIE